MPRKYYKKTIWSSDNNNSDSNTITNTRSKRKTNNSSYSSSNNSVSDSNNESNNQTTSNNTNTDPDYNPSNDNLNESSSESISSYSQSKNIKNKKKTKNDDNLLILSETSTNSDLISKKLNPKKRKINSDENRIKKRTKLTDLNKNTQLRTSNRIRFKPIPYWKNESIEYTKNVLTKDYILKNDKKYKDYIANKDILDTINNENSSDGDIDDDFDIDDDNMLKEYGFNISESGADEGINIYNDKTNCMEMVNVFKQNGSIKMKKIKQKQNKKSKNNKIFAGKGIHNNEFAAGMLLIPPNCIKTTNIDNFDCVYFIDSCENGKLEYCLINDHVGKQYFKLGKGCIFFAPKQNSYSIKNNSNKKPAKIFFNLIKNGMNIE